MSHKMTSRTPFYQWSLLIGFALASLALVIGLNLWRGINHDEHQFVAAGALIARGLHPYTDFPYFHVPLLAYLYGLLFQIFPALLLSARLFSVFWGWLTLLLLGWIAYTRVGTGLRLPAALSMMSLLLAAPLFIHTSGRAWNHDLPGFLLLLAYLAYPHSNQQPTSQGKRGLALFICGTLISLAAGIRLTFALIAPAFLLAAWWACWQQRAAKSHVWRELLSTALWFGGGSLLGLLPTLWVAWPDPMVFWFGNVEYIRLNTVYYRSLHPAPVAMHLLGKLRYGFELLVFQPGNLLVLSSVAIACWPSRAPTTDRRSQRPLLLLLLGLSGLAALGPTPSQWQYFYLLLPICLLLTIDCLTAHTIETQRARLRWIGGAALLALLLAVPRYIPAVTTLFKPQSWLPWTVHQHGQIIAQLVGEEEVLSLAPVYPLEGGAAIDPALATGPFAWRVADFVPDERRAELGLIAPTDLPSHWRTDPPRGVLTDIEVDDKSEEAPLVEQVQAHGFVPVELPDDGILWLSPQHDWGGAIRLGGHTLPRDPVTPGSTFVVTFYLQNRAPLHTDLNVLVRVLNAQGEELLRNEGWPWGSATSSWELHSVWQDGHTLTVPADAEAGVYGVELGFYDPATLELLDHPVIVGYLLVADTAAQPSGETLAIFGEQILLQRSEEAAPPTAQQLLPGATIHFTLHWQALVRPAGDYTRFAHVIGPGGALITQQDQPPLAGFYPTSAWQPGYTVRDEVELQVPPTAPPGTYQILVGFYEPQTGQRLPVQDHIDAFTVGTFQVP